MSNRITPVSYRKTVSRDTTSNRMTSNVMQHKDKAVISTDIKGALLGVKKQLGYKKDTFNSRLQSKVPELESLKEDLILTSPEESEMDNMIPDSPSPPPLSPVKVKVLPLDEPIYLLRMPEDDGIYE